MASTVPVSKVSDYFRGTVNAAEGDNVTHLKLQKLLYYAQGFHLAMHAGEPLFRNPIEAWVNGPVVRQVWNTFKDQSNQALPPPGDFDLYSYLPEVRELLDAVADVYGRYTATVLSTLTHKEDPWLSTYDHTRGGIQSNTIESSKIRSFFSTMVDAGRRDEAIPGHPVWPTNSFRFQKRAKIAARISSFNINYTSIPAFTPESDPDGV